MKFCYVDESGMGTEPYAVFAGVFVDSLRMHKTKNQWTVFLKDIETHIKKPISELHARDLYGKRGVWEKVDYGDRDGVINSILDWLIARKHDINFSSIDKEKFNNTKEPKIKEIGSIWCFLALHHILASQRYFQKTDKTKGHILFVFDHKLKEENKLREIVKIPPAWTNTYYSKKPNQKQLSHIIDVPYYADSEDVYLLQLADLIAFLLRRYAELHAADSKERYYGEQAKIDNWIKKIKSRCLPISCRYPSKSRCECANIFYEYAPQPLRDL